MNILIMTATILPPVGAPGLSRTNPLVRLDDYKNAFMHYIGFLDKEVDSIIFVENSSSDISDLREIAERRNVSDKIEFISYNGMDHLPIFGRCYSESRLLDYAMTHSEFVRAAGDAVIFWKVTGRYKLLNLSQMFKTRPAHSLFYCDLRKTRSPWADMRLMAWTKRGYESVFREIGEHIREDKNNGRPGEESLFHHLSTKFSILGFVGFLQREPQFDGARGFDSQNWNEGRQKLVYVMRQFQRTVFQKVFA